jgi:nitrous oxidase accessory protein NosD
MRLPPIILGLGLLASGVTPALAKTPIDAPQTIDKPGSYVVRKNLRSIANPVLVIASDDVVIDLDGHTLAVERAACCAVALETVVGVRIENGSIVGDGGGIGVLAQASPELVLQNLTFRELQTAVRLVDSRAATLRHNRVARGVGIGVDIVHGEGFVVEDNVLEAETGLLLGAQTSSIARNNFGGEVQTAPLRLTAEATSNALRDNVVRSNGPGIVVEGTANELEGNVIRAAGCSLWFKPTAQGNVYRANTARGNPAGCACPITPHGSLCDEGRDNQSHGDNYLPDRF